MQYGCGQLGRRQHEAAAHPPCRMFMSMFLGRRCALLVIPNIASVTAALKTSQVASHTNTQLQQRQERLEPARARACFAHRIAAAAGTAGPKHHVSLF